MILSGSSSEDGDGRCFSLPELGFLHEAVRGNNALGSFATTRIVGVSLQKMTRHTMLVCAFVLCPLFISSFHSREYLLKRLAILRGNDKKMKSLQKSMLQAKDGCGLFT